MQKLHFKNTYFVEDFNYEKKSFSTDFSIGDYLDKW